MSMNYLIDSVRKIFNKSCKYEGGIAGSLQAVKIGDFRQYSYHNCIAYQKIQIIRNLCNCIPYFLPLQKEEINHICNFRDLECLEDVLKPKDPMSQIFGQDYVKCLPECEHYDYPLEVAVGKLANSLPPNGLPLFSDINFQNGSILNVFFNDLVSTRYRRDVYLNWQNILSAFGGLLSLMLGFTLISGIDIFLFFTFNVFYEFFTIKFPNFGKNFKNKINPNQSSNVQVQVNSKEATKTEIVHGEHNKHTNYQLRYRY